MLFRSSVYIPTSCARGFPFSTSSPTFIVCRFFGDGHSDWYELTLHFSFDLHSSHNEKYEHFSMCLLPICISSLKKYLFRSSAYFLIFFYIELHALLIYFGDQSFVSCFVCKCFFPFGGCPFHLVHGFLCCVKTFKFN